MSMRRLLAAFYTFVALRWFRLTAALWMLYLLHVGWSLWQVGLAEAAFHVVSFLAAVPTGAYADRIGRRRSVVVGLIIAVIANPLTLWLAPMSVALGTLALAFHALSFSFIGGADQALLYDLARLLPAGENGFNRLYGRMDALGLFSGAVAEVIGGWLAVHLGWAWPYLGEAGVTLLAIPLVLTLPASNPSAPSDSPQVGGPVSAIAEAWRALRSRPELMSFVVFGAVLGIAVTSNHLYAQTTLVTKGETVVVATAIIGAGSLLAAVASSLTHRLGSGRKATSALRRGALLIAASIGSLGYATGLAVPLLYGASALLDGSLYVLFVTELSQRSPDALRATILSAPESAFSLGMILCFPLEGFAMGRFGLGPTYAALGVMLLLATLGTGRALIAGRQRESASASG